MTLGAGIAIGAIWLAVAATAFTLGPVSIGIAFFAMLATLFIAECN